MTITCAQPELSDLLGAYAAGRLRDTEREAVELHLLECGACQAELRAGLDVRAAGRVHSPNRPLAHTLNRVPHWVRWAAPLAAAAGIAALLIAKPWNPYAELGRIESAPRFAGMPSRAAATTDLATIDSGMAAYSRGAYRRAEAFLARAVENDDRPGTQFFLGVTQLLNGRSRQAMTPLRNALHPAGNPYEAEAHFYLAKAWLRAGKPDSALHHLARVPGAAPIAEPARSLEARIRAR